MGQYTKKPITIEAFRWTGGPDQREDPEWACDAIAAGVIQFVEAGLMSIHTTEGVMNASPGDWIIRGVEGEIYPCRESVFAATYAPAQTFGADMHFGEALDALKAGERVCRAGWNGKGMWLALTPGSTVPATAAKRTGALLAYVEAENVAEVQILPHIDMRAADGSLVIGWLASQTDMLAEDWMVLRSDQDQAA